MLYVHGFTDYFFQEELAAFFTDRGYAFYALDLRKCGRSLRDGHQPHYTSDLSFYDRELNAALDVIADETADRVIVAAHSTGGLITPLWLDRLRTTDPRRHAQVKGLLLNSPWFDLQGEAILRTGAVGTVIKGVGRVRSKAMLPAPCRARTATASTPIATASGCTTRGASHSAVFPSPSVGCRRYARGSVDCTGASTSASPPWSCDRTGRTCVGVPSRGRHRRLRSGREADRAVVRGHRLSGPGRRRPGRPPRRLPPGTPSAVPPTTRSRHG